VFPVFFFFHLGVTPPNGCFYTFFCSWVVNPNTSPPNQPPMLALQVEKRVAGVVSRVFFLEGTVFSFFFGTPPSSNTGWHVPPTWALPSPSFELRSCGTKLFFFNLTLTPFCLGTPTVQKQGFSPPSHSCLFDADLLGPVHTALLYTFLIQVRCPVGLALGPLVSTSPCVGFPHSLWSFLDPKQSLDPLGNKNPPLFPLPPVLLWEVPPLLSFFPFIFQWASPGAPHYLF